MNLIEDRLELGLLVVLLGHSIEVSGQSVDFPSRDGGRGIEDFSKFLDLGGSGWEGSLDAGEDPAGVSILCLAPREVTIRSNGKRVSIGGGGWTGTPVAVHDDP